MYDARVDAFDLERHVRVDFFFRAVVSNRLQSRRGRRGGNESHGFARAGVAHALDASGAVGVLGAAGLDTSERAGRLAQDEREFTAT